MPQGEAATRGREKRRMAAASIVLALASASPLTADGGIAQASRNRLRTYANPIDLPYRYQKGQSPYREAADPTMVVFRGRYWLFPSHSKGYWHSTDLLHWTFVEGSGYDVDKYAPTVVEIRGKLYLATSEHARKIWVTDDPLSGKWREAATISPGYDDPCLFLDDDGRLYMYDGLSGTDVLRVAELDPKTFRQIRTVSIPQSRDKSRRGWEVVGDRNERESAPSYIEGSWVNKHRGRYYLQYSAPGTEFKTYADGVLVADRPMGPFTYQDYSPFDAKPTGFVAGAGHGSTFQGRDGRWWHVGTMTISRRHPFERRLGLFPASFASSGELIADTYLGDYPHYIDGNRGLVGWMLLSRHRPVAASSSLEGFAPELAVDEDVRTWWSARTGDAGEWFQVDLGAPARIDAVQVNFADQDSQGLGISVDGYRYTIEGSLDGRSWTTLVAAAATGRDSPHAYSVLRHEQRARFVRIRNLHAPDGGKFSLSDFRVFGIGDMPLPGRVENALASRDRNDGRKVNFKWSPVPGAEFYVVRFGTRPNLMNQSYQVYDGATSLTAGSLNLGTRYYFTVDAVNRRGISAGKPVGTIG
jgi:xylan 1,4-beta-xylosidase